MKKGQQNANQKIEVTDEERYTLRKSYLELTEKSEKDSTFVEIGETLNKATVLFGGVRTPNEAVYDSSLLQKCSENTLKLIHLNKNTSGFDCSEFALKLIAYESTKLQPTFDEHQWAKVGSLLLIPFKRSPCLNIVYGCNNMTEIKVKVRLPRQVHVREELEKRPMEVTQGTKENTETTPAEVTRINEIFNQCWVKNKKQPLSYYKFLVDPHCFTTTVSNMFHFSFLFRDNKVKFTDDVNLQVEPMDPQKLEINQKKYEEKYTTAITITPIDWEKIVKDMNIKKAMIETKTTE